MMLVMYTKISNIIQNIKGGLKVENIEKYFQEVIRNKYNFSKEEEAIYIEKALKSSIVKNAFMEVINDEYNYKISNGDYDHLYKDESLEQKICIRCSKQLVEVKTELYCENCSLYQ